MQQPQIAFPPLTRVAVGIAAVGDGIAVGIELIIADDAACVIGGVAD